MSQDVCLGRMAKPTEISWTRQLHRQSCWAFSWPSCAVCSPTRLAIQTKYQTCVDGNLGRAGTERSVRVDGERQKDGQCHLLCDW